MQKAENFKLKIQLKDRWSLDLPQIRLKINKIKIKGRKIAKHK